MARTGRAGPTPIEWACGAVVLASLLACATLLLGSGARPGHTEAGLPANDRAPLPAVSRIEATSRHAEIGRAATRRIAPPAREAQARRGVVEELPVAYPAPPPPVATTVWTVQSIRALWIRAADRDDPSGDIEELDAFLRATSPDTPEAKVARRALDDLEALQSRRRDPDTATRDRGLDLAERTQELRDVLRFADDAGEIKRALRELAGRRDAAAAEAILAAGPLPGTALRSEHVGLLWRMAADGTDLGDQIRDRLERARYAADDEVAGLAERALNDLERLDALGLALERAAFHDAAITEIDDGDSARL